MRYSAKQYAAALHASLQNAGGKEFTGRVRAFIGILRKANTLKLLPRILAETEKLEGSSAEIISATELPKSAQSQIRQALGKGAVIEKNDPDLLGGIIVEWDDMRLDGSVRGRLKALRLKLLR